jgi:MoCo/4Fe-4S cofactor protein with predicted Tat translocation signal
MSDPRERYWRNLEAQLRRPEVREAIAREFPDSAVSPPSNLGRRDFVRLLGASMALAGLGACVKRPRERILAYVSNAVEATPTLARHYATSMTLDGFATGLLVESHAGRPSKIEGNPDHPASLGAAGIFEQASILGLYDPQRARSVRVAGRRSSWAAFLASIAEAPMRQAVGERGAGLHLLLEPTASPLVADLVARVRERYPDAQVHFHSAIENSAGRRGTAAAFGRELQPIYDFTSADVVFALEADFLATMPYALRYAHDFAERRRPMTPSDAMSRLYAIETAPTVTGRAADHRLRARPSEVSLLLAGVSQRIAKASGLSADVEAVLTAITNSAPTPHGAWLDAVAADLLSHKGRCVVIAGERQAPAIHALAHLLNVALANVGVTVRYIEPPISRGGGDVGLSALTDAMRSGDVAWLGVLEGNPAYTAPADLDFASLLARVPNTVYLGTYRNETARACRWFVPGQHYLESWGDGRAWDGTASLVQPLIEPLYSGHAATDLLASLAGEMRRPYELLKAGWEQRLRGDNTRWEEALQRGVIPKSESPAQSVRPDGRELIPLLQKLSTPAKPNSDLLELVLAPSATVHDGRFANNPWLQELPNPVTQLTWGNAAMVSPRTATRLGLDSGNLVELASGERRITVPVLIVPGHADAAVTVPLGYGRVAGGRADGAEQVADGVGTNGYVLRMSMNLEPLSQVSVRRLTDSRGRPRQVALAITQTHWQMDGRPLALAATLEEYRRQPVVAPRERGPSLSLYEPERQTAPDQWAMTIDLSACTGCSACVVACQAENNVPVVGTRGVLDSREMHWLRIDHYAEGPSDDPAILVQPMLCQHCEKAPCEYVCPVAATVHSPDGINEMVYNRCVGTRFCSNNCPYKVRRFNWFNYNAEVSETERLAKNPDVTVRARGVMEKCTFCIQRIREAQISARVAGRPLRAGEVRTACQQACPTRAIVFGSLTNAEDEVGQLRDHPRAYDVLHELGTEPRVRYLAHISNPNPRLSARPS